MNCAWNSPPPPTSPRSATSRIIPISISAGQGNGDILGHVVYINADATTPVDATLIPTGEIKPVDGTPFDFRKPTAIGARINDPDTVLQYGPGYDHNWVINKPLGQFGLMARVVEPDSGRVMEVWSTEPGLQFYAGNFLDGSHHRQGRQGLSAPLRLLHGTAALSRFAQQAAIPHHRIEARRNLSQHDHL